MAENRHFFNENAELYSSSVLCQSQRDFVNFIIKNSSKNQTLLDIGGGSGHLARTVLNSRPDIKITVLDPSEKMLEQIKEPEIKKIVGSLPSNLNTSSKFDFIHMSSVLHHVVGNSIKKSKKLSRESLFNIKKILSDNGYFFLKELYFEGYIYPGASRSLIFHVSQISNKTGISVPFKDIVNNLEVCFYTRNELISLFDKCGYEIVKTWDLDYNRTLSSKKRRSLKRKLILLKDWGEIAFLIKKKRY